MAHQKVHALPEEAYVLMGDFLEFALKKTREYGFRRLWLAGQWAKLLKCATVAEAPPKVAEPYGFTTHVRHGVLRGPETLAFLEALGFRGLFPGRPVFNTAREVFLALEGLPPEKKLPVFRAVLERVRELARRLSGGLEVRVSLVNYRKEIVFEL